MAAKNGFQAAVPVSREKPVLRAGIGWYSSIRFRSALEFWWHDDFKTQMPFFQTHPFGNPDS